MFGLDYSASTYVKAYRGGSVDWDALEWQARAIYAELYRKVDRHTGKLAVGALGPEAAVAGATRIPLPVVREHWGQLVMSRAVTVDATSVTIRDFVAAQTAVQSPAARKRAQRESGGARHEKGQASGSESRNVTSSAPPVTESDGTKRALSEEKQEEQEEQEPQSAPAGARGGPHAHTRELDAEPEQAPPPEPSAPSKAARIAAAHERYAGAYAKGASAALGGAAFAVARGELADLAMLLPTYALAPTGGRLIGPALDAWLERTAAEYVTATRSEAKYQAGFGPRAFGRWLATRAAGAQTSERPRPPARRDEIRQRGWVDDDAQFVADFERSLASELRRAPPDERAALEADRREGLAAELKRRATNRERAAAAAQAGAK